MAILTCEVCGKDYSSYKLIQKTCSSACRNKRYGMKTGRIVHNETSIPRNTVGAMSELFVAADLMKRGYSVFRALSPSCFCDLIAVKNGKSINIEVKTGYQNTNTNNFMFPPSINNFDVYGIYERNKNQVFYFDKEKNAIIDLQ